MIHSPSKNNRLVAIFTLNRDKFEFAFHHRIKSAQFGQSGVYFFNNKIVTYGLDNLHPKSDGLRSGMLIIDCNTKQEIIENFHFPAIPLTHFSPFCFLTFSGSYYAICDPITYKIHVKEIGENKITDSFAIGSPEFVYTDSLLKYFSKWETSAYRTNPVNKFHELHKVIDQKSRVWFCVMLDSSTFFIRYSRPASDANNSFDFVDHIWKKQNGKWAIKESRQLGKFLERPPYPEFVVGSKLYFDNELIHYSIFQDKRSRMSLDRDFYFPESQQVEDLDLYIYTFKF